MINNIVFIQYLFSQLPLSKLICPKADIFKLTFVTHFNSIQEKNIFYAFQCIFKSKFVFTKILNVNRGQCLFCYIVTMIKIYSCFKLKLTFFPFRFAFFGKALALMIDDSFWGKKKHADIRWPAFVVTPLLDLLNVECFLRPSYFFLEPPPPNFNESR